MRFASFVLTIAVAVPSVVHSQEATVRSWPVAVGSRIRVASPVFGKQVGIAASVAGDSIMFRSANDTAYRPIALAQISKLEVSTGTHSTKALKATYGFLI